MVKVFLVEDEAIIRHGIRDNIDWASHGFEFAGEAGDGEYAYPLILKAQPDILVTDIKMPFMDGLELSRLVKKTLPRTRIIVLSGYNEFEYAKEAIKIGISDYLLKPVSSAGLIDALKKAADEIREEREKSKLLERYFVSYEKYTEFLDKTDYSGVDRKLINDFLKLGSVEECSPFVQDRCRFHKFSYVHLIHLFSRFSGFPGLTAVYFLLCAGVFEEIESGSAGGSGKCG